MHFPLIKAKPSAKVGGFALEEYKGAEAM